MKELIIRDGETIRVGRTEPLVSCYVHCICFLSIMYGADVFFVWSPRTLVLGLRPTAQYFFLKMAFIHNVSQDTQGQYSYYEGMRCSTIVLTFGCPTAGNFFQIKPAHVLDALEAATIETDMDTLYAIGATKNNYQWHVTIKKNWIITNS